ncbi:hypothetical protein [Parafilimonas terrae]|uniref:Uncharacterized protein n=1 Tax=Parafilimonas terrae TaxID=1465490 RepID=A0A1I5V4U8_9BACT|nr:hypothetical protein [Parafilimonas terrae]SFQ02461.1 hypothetical protein SAMN05444277_104209 [Parafilimonas terrae]
MDNSFFVFSDVVTNNPVVIERSHICLWEFKNNSALVEFGFEVSKNSLPQNQLNINVFIPWLSKSAGEKDLYEKLSNSENSRFIFNDSIKQTQSLDDGRNKLGVIHEFANRDYLCILPISIIRKGNNILEVKIDLQHYRAAQADANIYFRFAITPQMPAISMHKKGISKSTIVYDIKVNERRNIPDQMLTFFSQRNFCAIKACFCFFIIPNDYDIVFFENDSLKSVRTLEYDAFTKYLGDKRVKQDELIVVFNKKKNSESFSFFSIFTKERIGPEQYILAILINMVSGILLFLPGFRTGINKETSVWKQLPVEFIIAILITVVTFLYFLWPKFKASKKELTLKT